MVAHGAGSQGTELEGKGVCGVLSCTEGKRKRDSCDTGVLVCSGKGGSFDASTFLVFVFLEFKILRKRLMQNGCWRQEN